MGCYDRVRFRGTFRDCQRRVLEHAQEYLDDGRLHIVAAPGSGKTVLGLELIRRLDAPCLILSPTSAIRSQWGERLRDLFLDDPEDLDALFSEDLHALKTVNSATYQALYAATQKGDADLIAGLRARDVRTVCLDEAHHLRNEWYRALETFLRDLDRDVTLICLTATPPYDAEGPEWRRYHAVCGEIDEEIFVPELVASGSLCPHQDYVLFNYPDENELATLRDHRDRASAALEAVGRLDALREACGKLQSRDPDRLYDPPEALTALLTLLEHFGYAADRKRIRRLTGRRTLPPFGMQCAETALQYLLDGDLLSGEGKEELAAVLKKHGVFEKGTVRLVLTDRLRRLLVGSAGTLESVARIARSELDAMGERLRMLVLTDHIKKESLAGITQRERFADVSVTSIFETLRRAVPEARIGVLSGSLVILPEAAGLPGADIPGTEYRSVELPDAVQTVGALLESGALQILVGTKALLGEGWDSPCVNTLVLASAVGSFVSSNQMRGRAMRVDPRDPRKTANIWHLATVAPDYLFEDSLPARAKAYMAQDENRLSSFDFDVLVRRFDAFMGPNDATGEIESGFERLTAIRPPFDAAGVERINREMLAAAAEGGPGPRGEAPARAHGAQRRALCAAGRPGPRADPPAPAGDHRRRRRPELRHDRPAVRRRLRAVPGRKAAAPAPQPRPLDPGPGRGRLSDPVPDRSDRTGGHRGRHRPQRAPSGLPQPARRVGPRSERVPDRRHGAVLPHRRSPLRARLARPCRPPVRPGLRLPRRHRQEAGARGAAGRESQKDRRTLHPRVHPHRRGPPDPAKMQDPVPHRRRPARGEAVPGSPILNNRSREHSLPGLRSLPPWNFVVH